MIERAQEKDKAQIVKILEELDLLATHQAFGGFWVAKKDGKVVGTARLKEYDNFFFLSSVGVRPGYQKHGIASQLIKELFTKAAKDIYLYTIIPDFFKKLGFKPVSPPAFLPPKDPVECQECIPEKCTCMVKSKHDS
ncbi:MAG: GNAT family N-acetyltransferase [Candidatus Margulisbacteria bacterium]|nr:GNAT family N-acetyltransferase [Candidatus Margulisiibacteriota bacterium]MBU1022354.1 GNAT family N-acetyltransferase [Candidatus Margulisiibacteriota bacterium]MBU1954485.1 GNAT family N-acetyltransferase [Candidatus Margulisiibacteriota bacterium]